MQIDYDFDEVSLVVGTDSQQRPQAIALISGTVTVSADAVRGDDGDGFEWYIDNIVLNGPCAGDPPVTVDATTPLFHWVVKSVEAVASEAIYEALREATQPDPDAAYERQRDMV